MEPNEIFGLIVKADERLKYATAENAVLQAEQRLADLGEADAR